ncbi:MAG: Acetyl-CoA decarbonylase/synthase complex subunit delta [Dehalococcoidia bacterium]|nr:Acetyl-CoA decarbonylase/synthase complex subunit delta [Dehalococcoidia bacterium]
MPAILVPTEKWAGKVREVTLGGDSRKKVVVGGETTLPFLHFDGVIPHAPAIAIDVEDVAPQNWSPVLGAVWGDVMREGLAAWARKAVEAGADMVALTLRSADPDMGNTGPAEAVEAVKKVLAAVDVPLIVYGPGIAAKDNEVLVAVSDAFAGKRLALGLCEDKNYRTIVATCMANGHIVIANSPIDINLAKQLNILITDMDMPGDRILMDPTTGALGYGLEYTYSVMERLRVAALLGDSMTAMPMILNPGREGWRFKEAKTRDGVPTQWGDLEGRGIAWETTTAIAQLQAGADILVMRHPKAVGLVKRAIASLMATNY